MASYKYPSSRRFVIVVLVTKFFYDGNKETAVKNEMLYRSTPPVNPEAKASTKEPEQA